MILYNIYFRRAGAARLGAAAAAVAGALLLFAGQASLGPGMLLY